jgi:hypothetical protein
MKFSNLVLTAALLLPYVGAGNGNGGGGQGNGNGNKKDEAVPDEEVPVTECPCYQAEEDIQVVLDAAVAGGGGVTACSGAQLIIAGSLTGPFSLITPNLGTLAASGNGDLTFSFLADTIETIECSFDGVVQLAGGTLVVNGSSESSSETAPYAACAEILASFC